MSLESLREKNSIAVRSVTDPAFARFGRVVDDLDCSGIRKRLTEGSPLPGAPEETIYEPSAAVLENGPEKALLEQRIYGGMEIQMGYCNGRNTLLNALEYHKGNEVIVAGDDIVLLLACLSDLRGGRLCADQVEAFFQEAGQAVELYGTTLHYAPCQATSAGFRAAIILPRDTNLALPFAPAASGEARTLRAVNKWLLAHDENAELLDDGAFAGIGGENIRILV